ncbi:MAG: ABC transporter permease, partial [Phycisphaeraceae bacterium]
MDNPIVKRELLGTLRTRRALVVQILLAIALAALVLLRWPTDARVDFDGLRAQQVLSVFGYGLLTGVILLAPVFPAASIVRERQAGTLALLLNSPMKASSIAAGKLAGSLGFILLLILLSAPPAAACFAMGGIDAGDFAMMYLVVFALAFQYATLGLLISSFATSVDSSLRLTFGGVLLLAVISLGPHQFLGATATGTTATVIEWVRCLSPIPAMAEAMGNDTVLTGGLSTTGSAARFIVLALLSGAGFLGWTALRLNQRLFDKPRDAGQVTDERSRGAQVFRRIMYLWFFDPQKRSGLIGPLSNPVMVKEQRCRRFGRGHWMMRMIGACLILSLALVLATTSRTIEWGVESLGGVMVALQMGLVILITPALASGLISSERETGGWQLMRMTPLSPITIIVGKLLSVTWTLLLLLLATVPA